MGFVTEINELLGIDNIKNDLFITFMPSKGAVIQGYKKLLEITETTVVVVGNNKRKIKVTGLGLEIFSLAPSEVVVHGKVTTVEELHE